MFVVSCMYHSWLGLFIMRGPECFLLGGNRKQGCHSCCTTENGDLGDVRVYSAVNHHVCSDLYGSVMGEMPTKCSRHNLMRWFRCSSMPANVLYNWETSTPQFSWPACVTSTSVCVSRIARSPVKHAEKLQRETGVLQAVNQYELCGLKCWKFGRVRNS